MENKNFMDEETAMDEGETRLLQAVAENDAIITDNHIVYTSGRHGSTYINKEALYQDTRTASLMGKLLAEKFQGAEIEAVVGPALGGIILSQWTAHHLSELTNKKIYSVYAEKTGVNQAEQGFEVKRGYDRLIDGRRVLLVEDIVTTGGSVFKLRDAIKDKVGSIVGLGLICNRGNVDFSEAGVGEVKSLLSLNFESWDQKDCILCEKKQPINVEVGKGKEFLEKGL